MANPNSILSQEVLHELFEYKDGNLIRKKTNSIAGSIDTNGYLITSVLGKKQKNHRIIFLMHYGYLPKIIDHIDRNPANNKIENLRAASRSLNCLNSKINKTNKSGVKNVDFLKSKKKWRVLMQIQKKSYFFGYFSDLELAALVAEEAKDKYMRLSFGNLQTI
jgi:hypothetical protein